MSISENRAININLLNGNSFPVNIEFKKVNEIYRIYLMPISILEIMDLISQDTFLVFNVDANEYDESKAITLKSLAEKYSSYSKAFDEETLLIGKQSLVRLLNEISHYNFCLINTDKEIELEEVIQIIDVADKWDDINVTGEVNANIFLSSHDDCCVYFETNDENLALELIGLQIKILVSTVTNFTLDKMKFNPKELVMKDEFSIVISQNPVEISQRITWAILEGTFKDFVYSKEMNKSEFELVYEKLNGNIKIKKV